MWIQFIQARLVNSKVEAWRKQSTVVNYITLVIWTIAIITELEVVNCTLVIITSGKRQEDNKTIRETVTEMFFATG